MELFGRPGNELASGYFLADPLPTQSATKTRFNNPLRQLRQSHTREALFHTAASRPCVATQTVYTAVRFAASSLTTAALDVPSSDSSVGLGGRIGEG